MVQKAVTDTLIALGFLVTSSISSPSATPHAGINSLKQIQDYDYVVEKGETMRSIAQDSYGSEDYWTTIWNDNPQLPSPNSLETDMKLTIRFMQPMLPEYLDETLQKRSNETNIPTHAGVRYSRLETNSNEDVPPVRTQYTGGTLNEAQINYLGTCESGMTATRNSGNGFYGAFQFMPSTWRAMNTEYERADYAPLEVQKDAVQRLLSKSSIYTQFPGCARKMQLAGLL